MARATDSDGAVADSNVITITILPASGTAYQWKATGTGKWTDPGNWSPAGVPGPNDLAELRLGGTIDIGDSAITVGSLTIADNSVIVGPGTLTINNSLSFRRGTFDNVQITINEKAECVISGEGRTEFLNSSVDNRGTAKWHRTESSLIVADAETEFRNSGTFVVEAGSSETPETVELGRVSNSGLVKISGRVRWGRYTQTAGELNLYEASGCADCTQENRLQRTVLTVQDEARLEGGTWTGNGTIVGNVINLGAKLLPGDSPGSLAVQGDYTQGANGLLAIEIGGTQPGQFDQLIVSGTAHLDGTLSIRTVNNFTPDPATQFTPLQFASANGDFATTSSNADVTVTSTGVEVNVTGPNPPAPQAQNLSTRLAVQTGENVLISGFIITGPAGSSKTIALRGMGPSLSLNGVPIAARLSDPLLELHNAAGATISANDDWKEADNANDVPAILQPSDDRESVLLTSLAPGLYSAIVKGASDATGIGLAEIYDLDPPSATQLANISTRGFVDTGDNVLIGGFIIGGTDPAKVLVRAIGPTLAGGGVNNPLADPTLELHDANGAVIANDDWRNTQETEISATGIPPLDDRESAILGRLTPGLYSAVVRGKDDSVGVGLVEIYMLQ